jgi:protein ImuB
MMRRIASLSPPGAPIRTIVLWCPDWPITAALRLLGASALGASAPNASTVNASTVNLGTLSAGATHDLTAADTPLALIDAGQVFACSASARSEGVRRGLRLREAQAR